MYKKDFTEWSSLKEVIHVTREIKWAKERDIWWCELGVNVGYEQDGTGKSYERPVLIIKTFGKATCLIVPLSTAHKKNLFYVDIGIVDTKPASVIISQIRLIDTRRLEEKITKLNQKIYEEVKKSIRQLIE